MKKREWDFLTEKEKKEYWADLVMCFVAFAVAVSVLGFVNFMGWMG